MLARYSRFAIGEPRPQAAALTLRVKERLPRGTRSRLPNARLGDLGGASKVKPEASGKRPDAGQLGVQGKGVKPIVLIVDVQDADSHLGPALQETIAGKQVELPEVVSGDVGRVPVIGLERPNGVGLREEAA